MALNDQCTPVSRCFIPPQPPLWFTPVNSLPSRMIHKTSFLATGVLLPQTGLSSGLAISNLSTGLTRYLTLSWFVTPFMTTTTCLYCYTGSPGRTSYLNSTYLYPTVSCIMLGLSSLKFPKISAHIFMKIVALMYPTKIAASEYSIKSSVAEPIRLGSTLISIQYGFSNSAIQH